MDVIESAVLHQGSRAESIETMRRLSAPHTRLFVDNVFAPGWSG